MIQNEEALPTPGKPCQPTPLPTLQVLCVIFIQISEAINVSVLFPFMAFLVEDMGYTGNQLGYHTGLLAAAFCGAQFISSVPWGIISDTFGRKPALVLGTLGAAVGMLLFGTAKTFERAVLGRLISGFLSGNMGALKSFLAETTDDTNRGIGFSYMMLGWSIGSIFAPLAGGLLSNPAVKYPGVFSSSSIFAEYSYLLPCLLCACWNVFSSLYAFCIMTETNKDAALSGCSSKVCPSDPICLLGACNMVCSIANKAKGQAGIMVAETSRGTVNACDKADDHREFLDGSDDGVELCNKYSRHEVIEDKPELVILPMTDNGIVNSVCDDTKGHDDPAEDAVDGEAETEEMCCTFMDGWLNSVFCRKKAGRVHYAAAPSSDLDEDDLPVCSNDVECGGNYFTDTSCGADVKHSIKAILPRPSSPSDSPTSVLRRRSVVLAVLNYAMVAASSIVLEETLPLFLKQNVAGGGMGFNSSQIGALLSVAGAGMLPFSLLLLPALSQRSKFWLMQVSLTGVFPLALCWPLLGLLNVNVLSEVITDRATHTWLLWSLCAALWLAFCMMDSLMFTAVIVLVNNSVSSKHLGAVNGMGQSFAALARSVGPALGGTLWSIATEHHFVFLNFIAVVVLYTMCLIISKQLPRSLDLAKRPNSGVGNNGVC